MKGNENKMRLILCFIYLCLLLAWFFGGTILAWAQEASFNQTLELSLSDTIDRALEASENLKLKNNMIKRKMSERKKEKAPLLPQISGELGWSNNFEYPDVSTTAAMQKYHVGAGLSISQTLFTFGRISNAVSAAQESLEASRSDRKSSRREIIYDAKIAFYQVALTKRILEIVKESYDNALSNKNILEERSSGGRSSEYDNIKISSDIASRKPTVNNAQADFLSAMETLKVLIGESTDCHIVLIKDINEEYPDFSRDELAVALYHNQPAIKTLALNIKEKELMVESKKAALLPEVSAFVTWNHKGDGDDHYVGRDYMDDYGVVGLRMSVPIWLGGENREELYQARIDKSDADLKYKKGGEEYLLMLDKALNAYREYKKTLEANNEALRLAEEAFRYSQELFSSGRVSVTDLNDAELQLTNIKISKEMTLFNLDSILAVLERLTASEKDNE